MLSSRRHRLLGKGLLLLTIVAVSLLTIGPIPVTAGDGTLETICHKPGTPAEHTIYVATEAVEAHLLHGDYTGECGAEAISACGWLRDGNADLSGVVGTQSVTYEWPTDGTGFAEGEQLNWTSNARDTRTQGVAITISDGGTGSVLFKTSAWSGFWQVDSTTAAVTNGVLEVLVYGTENYPTSITVTCAAPR
jgi:hypothetical protein